MNDPNRSNKPKRLAFMLSGGIDALIGVGLLLLGFGVFPVELADYGFQNWHALALGSLMFLIGVATVAYNLSRMEE